MKKKHVIDPNDIVTGAHAPDKAEQPCYTGFPDTEEKQRNKGNTPSRGRKKKPPAAAGAAKPFKSPLEMVIRAAIEDHLADQDREADEPFHTPLWTFTRRIKGYLREDTAERTFDKVTVRLKRHGGWEALGMSYEEAYLEFVSCWDKIRYEPGLGPLETAIEKAKKQPVSPDRCKTRELPMYALFVSTAGWLQVIIGDRSIALPCRKLAEVFTSAGHKANPMKIKRLRDLAVQDGYLRKTRDHVFRSKGQSEATEFRFDVSRFDCLREAGKNGCAAVFQAEGREGPHDPA